MQCGNSNIASFQSLKGWFNKAKQNCEQVLEKYSEPLQFGNRAIQIKKEAVQKYMKASKIPKNHPAKLYSKKWRDLSIHSSGLVGDVATDLFQIGSNDYIALVDRYSGWPMCAKLRSKTTESSTPL